MARPSRRGVVGRVVSGVFGILALAAGCGRQEEGVTFGDGPGATPPDAPVAAPAEVAAPAVVPTGRPITRAELVARCEPSVALVKGKVSSGTGFLVGPGLVATNAHVLDEEFIETIEVRFPSAGAGRVGPLPAELLYEDPERDVAFLRVATDLPPLTLAGAYPFGKGEDVTIIGNPGLGDGDLVLENAVSPGVMSSKVTLDGKAYFQLGTSINPGNSGGPVFGPTGLVIGMATLKASKQEGVAFCIPPDELLAAAGKAQAREAAGIADASARHRLISAFKRLTTSGALLAIALDIQRLERANGQTLKLHLGDREMTSQQFTDKLIGIEAKVSNGLAAAAAAARNESASDPVTRGKIGELAANREAMKGAYDARIGDKTRNQDLKRNHRRLIDEVKAALNVEVSARMLTVFEDHDPAESMGALASAGPRMGFGRSGLDLRMQEQRQRMDQRRAESQNRLNDMRSRMQSRRLGR